MFKYFIIKVFGWGIMDFGSSLINFLRIFWNILSSLSVLITLICFLYPNGMYPVISFFFKKIRERKLKNSELEIILIYDYNIFEIKDIYEYKKDLDKLFSDFNLISVVEDNLIKGNFKRRKYSIYSKFRMPSDMENNLHYTQTVTVDYVDFKDCLSTLFDNIRLINNLNYVSDDLKEFNIRIGTDFFNDNKLIKLMGSSITGDFTIKKEEKETILIYNGGLIQESIHHLNKIIIALADF